MDPVVISIVVIAVATAANVVISAFLWKATVASTNIARLALGAMQRPYLYIDGISSSLGPLAIELTATLKNCGSLPAANVIVTWDAYSDKNSVHHSTDDLAILAPNGQGTTRCNLQGPYWATIHAAQTDFEVEIQIEYLGVTGSQHRYAERLRYSQDGTTKRLWSRGDSEIVRERSKLIPHTV